MRADAQAIIRYFDHLKWKIQEEKEHVEEKKKFKLFKDKEGKRHSGKEVKDAQEFLRWLRKMIKTKKMSINKSDSSLYKVNKGILIKDKAFEDFAKEKKKDAKSVKSGFLKLGIHAKGAGNDHVHGYVDTSSGKKMLGVVVKNPALLVNYQGRIDNLKQTRKLATLPLAALVPEIRAQAQGKHLQHAQEKGEEGLKEAVENIIKPPTPPTGSGF